MNMRVLPLQTFSRRTCARHFFDKKPEDSQHLVPDSFDSTYSTAKKCPQRNQDNLQAQAFKSIPALENGQIYTIFSFLRIAGCFMYFSQKSSRLLGLLIFAAMKFSRTHYGNSDHPTDRANECLPLRRTWTFCTESSTFKIPMSRQEPWECWLSRRLRNILDLPFEGQTGELKPMVSKKVCRKHVLKTIVFLCRISWLQFCAFLSSALQFFAFLSGCE